MYALQISSFGEPSEVVELVDMAEPKAPVANQVLLALEYAPINPANLLTIRGRYGVLPSLPALTGSEGVGRVLAVGDEVKGLEIGDRVLVPYSNFTWREKIVVSATGLFPLPPNADPQQLAMLSVNPPTAALLLSEHTTLSSGDWILQNAGNSGVGRAVIAFAKERGLRTVSLVRRQELVEELLAAGGDVVLVDGPKVAERVAEATATGKAKIALAFDGVGGEALLSLTRALAPGGTLVVYSAMSGKPGQVSATDLIFRNLTIRSFWLENSHYHASPRVIEALKTGATLIAEGKLHVPVAATYPLTRAKEAITHAQSGGKVLFELSAR